MEDIQIVDGKVQLTETFSSESTNIYTKEELRVMMSDIQGQIDFLETKKNRIQRMSDLLEEK